MYSNTSPDKVNIHYPQQNLYPVVNQVNTTTPTRPSCVSRTLIIVIYNFFKYLLFGMLATNKMIRFLFWKILEGVLSVLFAFIVKFRFISTYWTYLASDLFKFYLSSHVIFCVLSISAICIPKKNYVRNSISVGVVCTIMYFLLFFRKKVNILNVLLMLGSFAEGVAYAVYAGQMTIVDKLLFNQEVFIASSVLTYFFNYHFV